MFLTGGTPSNPREPQERSWNIFSCQVLIPACSPSYLPSFPFCQNISEIKAWKTVLESRYDSLFQVGISTVGLCSGFSLSLYYLVPPALCAIWNVHQNSQIFTGLIPKTSSGVQIKAPFQAGISIAGFCSGFPSQYLPVSQALCAIWNLHQNSQIFPGLTSQQQLWSADKRPFSRQEFPHLAFSLTIFACILGLVWILVSSLKSSLEFPNIPPFLFPVGPSQEKILLLSIFSLLCNFLIFLIAEFTCNFPIICFQRGCFGVCCFFGVILELMTPTCAFHGRRQ